MKKKLIKAVILPLLFVAAQVQSKPNIVLLISDDTGWGDPGIYGGGVGRGMATPNIDNIEIYPGVCEE